MGEYVSHWDIDNKEWIGQAPTPFISSVSEQALPALVDFENRFILSLGGRRSGKTYVEAQKAVMLAIKFPGKKGMVVSPTYRQARNVWDHIYGIIPRTWLLPGRFGLRRSDFEMRFINGARIVFRSADRPDACRSDGVAWLCIDERQDVDDEAAGNAHLSCSEGGDNYRVFETATIKAEFREHYNKIKKNPNGHCYRMRSKGNPYIGHVLFDEAENILDARTYAQEIEAKWPEIQGRIYYPFKDHLISSYPVANLRDTTRQVLNTRFGTPEIGKGAAKYLISIDPPHSAVVWCIYEDDTMHAIDEVIIGDDWKDGDVKTLARRCASRYLPAVVIVDPHDTKWDYAVNKHFKTEGFRIASMPRLKIEYRLTAVRAKMERGELLVDPRCKYLIESLEKQKYDPNTGKPDKKTFYTGTGMNDTLTLDHIADACGYGVYKMYPTRIEYVRDETKAA